MSISSNSTDSNSQVSCGARENEYIGANFPFRQPDDDDGCRRTTTVHYDCASSAVNQTMANPNIDNGNNNFTNASTFSGPASKMPFEQRIHQLNCNIPLANMAESASSANSPCNMEVYRLLSKSPSSSISSSHASQAIHDFNNSTLTPFCCSTNIIPSGKRQNGNDSTARRNQATSSNSSSVILDHNNAKKNSKPCSSKNNTRTENKFGGSGGSITQSNNSIRTNTSLSISSSQMKRSFETMLKNIDDDLSNLRQPSVFFSCGSHINSIHTKKWSEKERKDLIALADRWLPSKKRGSGGERKMMKSGEKEGVDDEKEE